MNWNKNTDNAFRLLTGRLRKSIDIWSGQEPFQACSIYLDASALVKKRKCVSMHLRWSIDIIYECHLLAHELTSRGLLSCVFANHISRRLWGFQRIIWWTLNLNSLQQLHSSCTCRADNAKVLILRDGFSTEQKKRSSLIFYFFLFYFFYIAEHNLLQSLLPSSPWSCHTRTSICRAHRLHVWTVVF